MRRNYWSPSSPPEHPPGDDAVVECDDVGAEIFCPSKRKFAGYNRPIHIGYDQTNSQPSTVADMLWLLDVHPVTRCLILGPGQGGRRRSGDLVTKHRCWD